MKTWPIIEHDQNRGDRIFDIVTADHAEDLHVGDDVMVVCADHDRRPRSDGEGYWPVLDGGSYAFLAEVTEVKPTKDDPTLFLVRAKTKEPPASHEG